MSELPMVSAVVTTHNRLDLLPRALDSVAMQDYSNLELVVVDDGSEQPADSVVEQYRDVLPVRYIRNEQPQGACRARNQGIEAASGIFVAGLDDDDAWAEQRISRLMGAYSDDWAFVTSDVRMMYEKGAPVWRKPKEITLDDLLYSNYVGNQGLIKKERLLAVGGFDESLEAAQDYDLWIRLAKQFGPIKNVQRPLQKIYLEHGGKRISNPRDQLRGYLKFYNKHKNLMNAQQRKYQIYQIRRTQQKPVTLPEFVSCVPAFRFWKEVKQLLLRTYFN